MISHTQQWGGDPWQIERAFQISLEPSHYHTIRPTGVQLVREK